MSRGATRVLLIAATIVLTAPARASDRWRLVLVSEPGVELSNRLRAEAADLGLELAFESAPSSDAPSTIAGRHGAVGVLRVASPGTVELWIAAAAPRSASYETIRAQPGEGESFAFRVVEDVRARLTKLRLPEGALPESSAGAGRAGDDAPTAGAATPERAPEADSSARVDANRNARRIAASAGVGASAAGGGMGATPHAAIALQVPVGSGWSTHVEGLVPLSADTFAAPEGSARVHVYLVTAGIDRDVWERGSWSAAVGAGAGTVILAMEGSPANGFVAKDDKLVAGLFFVRARLGSELTRWLSVHGVLMGGASVPRPTVRFDGREAAAWGRPFAAGVVMLDFVM
jgi:hypothetical protein